MPRKVLTLSEAIWRKVVVVSADQCWEFSGMTDKDGYGRVWVPGTRNPRRPLQAHRAAYEDRIGPIPDGLLVLHKCDNPPCCNPNHLFLGTHGINMHDKGQKGRAPSGNLNGARKQIAQVKRGSEWLLLHPNQNGQRGLVPEDIRKIRQMITDGESCKRVAEIFKIDAGYVSRIFTRRAWASVA